MKILFIAPIYTGGIGAHLARIAQKLSEHGFETSLMKAPHIPIKNLKNPSFSLFSTIKVLTSRETYDIVHAINVPSSFAMRHTKAKKKVLSMHGMYSEQIGVLHSKAMTSLARLAESNAIRWADMLTTDSKAVQKQYKEEMDADIEYMPAPLDVTEFENVPDVSKKERQVVYVGRDSYEKGIDILKKIESQIDADIVYCTDLKWEEAMARLKESSILVVPSRMESLPQVIKEAFYLKVPVIATDVGGNSEAITHEKNGILIPSENPEKMTEAINRLLAEKDLANNLAENGYEYLMKNMTWDTLLPKYVKFYEDLLNS